MCRICFKIFQVGLAKRAQGVKMTTVRPVTPQVQSLRPNGRTPPSYPHPLKHLPTTHQINVTYTI